jgi:hypothetical protein
MNREYVIISHGTPICIARTAREANRVVSKLGSPIGVTVEGVDASFDVDVLRREAEAIGLEVGMGKRTPITSLMKSFVRLCEQGLPFNEEEQKKYHALLNEIAFWLPFWTYKNWTQMAMDHLELHGWEDESIPVYPSVPEVLYSRK